MVDFTRDPNKSLPPSHAGKAAQIRGRIRKSARVLYLDEAGAGTLCGDLVIAGVVVPRNFKIPGLKDSKEMTEKERNAFFPKIMALVEDYVTVKLRPATVDKMNVRQARAEGFRRAAMKLDPPPDYVVIDGDLMPVLPFPQDCLVRGDGQLPGLMVAGIVAKVIRDQQMRSAERRWPHYGFGSHKGYGTPAHMRVLRRFGSIPGFHRMSCEPVRKARICNVSALPPFDPSDHAPVSRRPSVRKVPGSRVSAKKPVKAVAVARKAPKKATRKVAKKSVSRPSGKPGKPGQVT